MWTIYDHPTDHPDDFVVRGFTVTADGPLPDQDVWLASSLDAARKRLPPNLHRIPRCAGDDPVIVETWL